MLEGKKTPRLSWNNPLTKCDIINRWTCLMCNEELKLWKLFFLSMYHSCEWQTLIFIWAKWKHVVVFSPHDGCVIFFSIIRLFVLDVFVYFVYTVCTCRDWCVCGAEFLYLTLECMYCTYIYFPPHVHHSKIKETELKKQIKEMYVICSVWAAACKHWYGPLICSHPQGRQIKERKWEWQNNLAIVVVIM